MEGIAQADQTANAELIRDEARHPPTHGLSPDHDLRPAAMLFDDTTKCVQQHWLAVRRAAFAALAPRGHVRKLEADHTNPAIAEIARHAGHERRVHRPTGAMREERNVRRLGWTVGEVVHSVIVGSGGGRWAVGGGRWAVGGGGGRWRWAVVTVVTALSSRAKSR